MIFSRFILAAVAVVGVIAAPYNAPGQPCPEAAKAVALNTRDATPYSTAMTKLDDLQSQVADTMAGPKSEREAKFLTITSSVLQVVKDYNSGYKSKLSPTNLSNSQNGEELNEFGKKLYLILRSCKGTRSAQLAANIGAINNEIEGFGGYLASLFPDWAAKILAGFGKYADRMTAIQQAVAA